MHVAAEYNRVDVIQRLLNDKVPVSIMDANKWTPLHYSAANGNEEATDLLILHGYYHKYSKLEAVIWLTLKRPHM